MCPHPSVSLSPVSGLVLYEVLQRALCVCVCVCVCGQSRLNDVYVDAELLVVLLN